MPHSNCSLLPVAAPIHGALSRCAKAVALALTTLLVISAYETRAQFSPDNPIPAPIPHGPLRVDLRTVVTRLVSPITLIAPADGTNRQFIVDQPGQIWVRKNGAVLPEPFLDVAARMLRLNPRYDERGLLGMAIDPGFADPASPGYQRIFTYTSEPVATSGAADFPNPYATALNHQSVVAAWRVSTSNPDVIDPATRREILRIDQPQSNHNGGMLAFGPDGHLYIGLGDGGGANDSNPNGHNPQIGNGQDNTMALGKILRIDVNGTNSANGHYGIPASNPFVTGGGLPEIFATGFRNPFRFSFDGSDFLVADVGQNKIEEVDRVEAGKNYGWRHKEGSFKFNTDGTISDDLTDLPAGLTDPILQYDHDEGISICGGYVYRGNAIPELHGKYVFADFSRSFSAPSGRLFYADLTTGEIRELVIGGGDAPLGLFVKGMGIDQDGELYVLASVTLGPANNTEGQPTGIALKLVPPPHYATGNSVPGAGVAGSGVPADAVFSAFGVPSINDAGEVAFTATYSSGGARATAILGPKPADRTVFTAIAVTGQKAPDSAGTPLPGGETFASFADPVLSAEGRIAFLAKLRSAPSRDTGIWTDVGGTLRLFAREGGPAPGATGAFKSFQALAIGNSRAGGSALAFVAALTGRGITAGNDLGLWIAVDGRPPVLSLREGQTHTDRAGSRTVKSFKALAAPVAAPGHGYGIVSEQVTAHATFTDGSQALLRISPGTVETLHTAGDSFEETSYKAFTSVTSSPNGYPAFTARLASETATDSAAVVMLPQGSGRIARKGDPAPGTDGNFSSFVTVTNNGEELSGAFIGRIRGGRATPATDTGVWWNRSGETSLVAREGDAAVGVTGGIWMSFQSLAFPQGAGAGPLFVAKLRAGSGVTPGSNTGLWAVDSAGAPHLVVRTGSSMRVGSAFRTVRGFTTLSLVPGSPAQTRSHNADRQLIYRVFFTDGSQAIQTATLP